MKQLIFISIFCYLLIPRYTYCQKQDRPDYAVGYSLDIRKITLEKLKEDKATGMDYIEIAGLGSFVNADLSLKIPQAEWLLKCDSLAIVLKKAAVKVWSIHMPFSAKIDISTLDEQQRQQVMRMHLQLLEGLYRLHPQVILFHPSYYLEPNRREPRKDQLVRSVNELYTAVSRAGGRAFVDGRGAGTTPTADRGRMSGTFRPLSSSGRHCRGYEPYCASRATAFGVWTTRQDAARRGWGWNEGKSLPAL